MRKISKESRTTNVTQRGLIYSKRMQLLFVKSFQWSEEFYLAIFRLLQVMGIELMRSMAFSMYRGYVCSSVEDGGDSGCSSWPPTILYYLSSNRIIIILIINYCYTGAAIGDV